MFLCQKEVQMNDVKKTPLYDKHLDFQGRMVEFAGYQLPIQYETISLEHHQVRQSVGLFDVSHMGEITVKGQEAEAFVHYLVTNNIKALETGQVAYTLMCYDSGGVVDDLLVYKKSTEDYLLVVNAANVDKDFKWIKDQATKYQVLVENVSDTYVQLALQGPKAQELLQAKLDYDLSSLGFFRFKDNLDLGSLKALISRTGYTGEDGFEIYVQAKDGPKLWDLLFEGNDILKPIGLGARDTLRFEACLPLYGHEISEDITPLEAGLKMFVDLEGDAFIGQDALRKQNQEGITRKLVGIELEKGIAREGALIVASGETIGHVTTGYKSPSLDKTIALALIDKSYAKIGSHIEVQVRKKTFAGQVISKRFYNKKYKK